MEKKDSFFCHGFNSELNTYSFSVDDLVLLNTVIKGKVRDQLRKLGYVVKVGRFGYAGVYYNGYRQHKTAYCTPAMADEILKNHKVVK